MRYCQIYDFTELGRITLYQYRLMMESVKLRVQDKERDIFMSAWLNQQVKATKEQGKKRVPYFKTFDSFYKPTELKKEKSVVSEQYKSEFRTLMLNANSTRGGG